MTVVDDRHARPKKICEQCWNDDHEGCVDWEEGRLLGGEAVCDCACAPLFERDSPDPEDAS